MGALQARMTALLREEARELGGHVRRLAPTRRHLGVLGLALLALIALGGVAGAAEPGPDTRSALEAWAASPAPAATTGAMAPGSGAATSSETLPSTAPALSPVFDGPNLLDLATKGALVGVLLFLTLRVLRRVQGGPSVRGGGLSLLDIVESRPLGAKMQLHLVAVGDRRLVVGQSPAGLVALGEFDLADLPMADTVDAEDAPHAADTLTLAADAAAASTAPVPAARRLPSRASIAADQEARVARADRMARVDRALAAADRAADAAERAALAAERAAGADRVPPRRSSAIPTARPAMIPVARPVAASTLARAAAAGGAPARETAAEVMERVLATSRAERAASPHTWSDERAAEDLAQRLAARLAEIDEENGRHHRRSASALPRRLEVSA